MHECLCGVIDGAGDQERCVGQSGGHIHDAGIWLGLEVWEQVNGQCNGTADVDVNFGAAHGDEVCRFVVDHR